MLTMQDRAATAAFESVVKCKYVSREELAGWNVSFELDSSQAFFTFVFKNVNGSRQIEVVVHARTKPHASGGEKMTVEITKVVEGHLNKLTRPHEGIVLFHRTVMDRTLQRMCAA